MLRSIGSFLGSFGILLCLASLSVAGTADTFATPVGWELERDVEVPSYAVTEPASTNLNIDSVVLSCEQGPSRRGLQLRLYLAGEGPLAPLGARKVLKDDPTVDLIIDGLTHSAQLLFADDFVVVADPLIALCHCCPTRFWMVCRRAGGWSSGFSSSRWHMGERRLSMALPLLICRPAKAVQRWLWCDAVLANSPP